MEYKKENKSAADKIEHEVVLVENALKIARKYGLEAEVMWSALRYCGDKHKGSNIDWALDAALSEWDVLTQDEENENEGQI